MNRFVKFFRIGWIKSLWLNFYCLPFKRAIHLPILISRNTRVRIANRDSIRFVGNGQLRIGFLDYDCSYDRGSLFSVQGKLILKGDGYHSFASGLVLSVTKGAVMEIGNNFTCSHNAHIAAVNNVTVGNDNMWSFDVLIMDTDTHQIYDEKGNVISKNLPVHIGNHVWIGCKNVILKGACIPDGSIVAAASTITSHKYPENSIISGGGKLIKEKINWSGKLNY